MDEKANPQEEQEGSAPNRKLDFLVYSIDLRGHRPKHPQKHILKTGDPPKEI